MKNGIYLVATPIGNKEDITFRAVEVLKNAEVIACEDTRVTKKLFSLLDISTGHKTFISLHNYNEEETAQSVIDEALKGNVVAYVSDAGSPLISDPGYKLAKKCREQGVYVTTIPGACAAVCGLQLSGLPTNTFMFVGFIPNKDKARKDFLEKYKDVETTLVFYETANRLLKTLESAKQVFGNREIAVAREISKIYEECQNGTAEELIAHFTENPPKGEIVLMVAPPQKAKKVDYEEELKAELQKQSLKSAVKKIIEKYDLNKNEVYQKALEFKNG
ncbi:MAG: 16S rRNA (cytidine(1402)-2'-O)-methyltransferase [Alphaproteobacteria bacterium]|nr:16S rRNA (cytidine(1402)-2'-O)-methyltransferase [Alphaproteobacteria bacterium]